MKKAVLLCILCFMPMMSHAADTLYTGPDFSTDEKAKDIISVVHTVLKVSFDDKPDDKSYRDRIINYMDQFDLDDTKNTFTVERVSSERLGEKDIYKYYRNRYNFSDTKSNDTTKLAGKTDDDCMKKEIYKQLYIVKNNHGFTLLSEVFVVPDICIKNEKSFKLDGIGKTYIISDVL